MIGEALWEQPEEDTIVVEESKEEHPSLDNTQQSLNNLEPFSDEESYSSEKRLHPALSAGKGILILVVVSWFLWNGLVNPLVEDTQANDYANEAMSWPSTPVHLDSEIEAWSEDVSCGEDTCYEEFFTANLVLNCALLEVDNYICGPDVQNGTLIQTELSCEPSYDFFSSGGGVQYAKRGPMPDPCIAVYDIWDYGHGGADFPRQYDDPRYEDPWEVYDTECKWQSEPNDEPYWNCYFDDGEYDTWWYHCEFAVNESLWFCIDAFGPDASAENNQNASERLGGSAQDILSDASDDVLEVRYDPADPTRVYIGDPEMVPSSAPAFIGFMIIGIAVLIGIIGVVSRVGNEMKKRR